MTQTMVFGVDSATSTEPQCVYLEYIDSLDSISSVSAHLVYDVASPSQSALYKVFQPGKTFKLTLAKGSTERLFEGTLLETEYRLKHKQLHVYAFGLDSLYKLKLGSKATAAYKGVKDSDVASQLATKYGLSGSSTAVSTSAADLFQGELTDAEMLLELARRNNYFVRVQEKKLVFAPYKAGTTTTDVSGKVPGTEVRLKASLEGIVTEVTARGYDFAASKAVEGKSSGSVLNISGGDSGVALAKKAFGDLKMDLDQMGTKVAGTLKALAEAEFQGRAGQFVTGTVATQGNIALKAGDMVNILDVPWPMLGKFLIRRARHVMEGDLYRTFVDFSSDSFPTASAF